MTAESPINKFNNPIVYVIDGDLPDGRIVAADFMGGSFDVRLDNFASSCPQRELGNTLALLAMGYTQRHVGDLTGVSRRKVGYRISELNNALCSDSSTTTRGIATAIKRDVLHITRNSSVHVTPSDLAATIWGKAAEGIPVKKLARNISTSTHGAEKILSGLYRDIGISNISAATLLRHMIPLEPERTYFQKSGIASSDGHISTVTFKGGIIDVSPQSQLTDIENDILLSRAVGLTRQQVSTKMFGDTTREHVRGAVDYSTNNALQKYEATSITGALRQMCLAGHIILQRECMEPRKQLTIYEQNMWEQYISGISYRDIAEQRGQSAEIVKAKSSALYKKLGVNLVASAALRGLMTYPLPEMLPLGNTYMVRSRGGIELPDPRSLR